MVSNERLAASPRGEMAHEVALPDMAPGTRAISLPPAAPMADSNPDLELEAVMPPPVVRPNARPRGPSALTQAALVVYGSVLGANLLMVLAGICTLAQCSIMLAAGALGGGALMIYESWRSAARRRRALEARRIPA